MSMTRDGGLMVYEWWKNGFGINNREQGYLKVKSQPKNDKYENGSVEARVILMVSWRFPTGERF